MLASLLVALTLAAPLGGSNSPRDRALTYYAEGLEQYSREKYTRALKSFEMALLLARFDLAETDLVADTLRMASSSALLAGDAKRAPSLARDYVDWATKHARGVEQLHARNDLIEALLLAGDANAAKDELQRASELAARGGSADEKNRLEGLAQRAHGIGQGVVRSSHDAATGSGDTVVVAHGVRVSRDDTAPQATTEPPAPQPAEIEGVIVRRQVVAVDADAVPEPEPAPQVVASNPVTTVANPTPAKVTAHMAANSEGMLLIPAGSFTMGDDRGGSDEKPTRSIELPAFWIDRLEVNNADYRRFVNESGYRAHGNWEDYAGPGHDQDPVRGVTHEDAEFYARAQGKRLPTEAEWERTARGEDGRGYAFGDAFAPDRARVGRAGNEGPAAVGTSEDGPWGVRDLTGNVMEWVSDWYDAKAYRSAYASASAGPKSGTHRVARGGAWDAGEREARNAARVAVPATRASSRVGFRCARDAE